jgi:pimeloyl-ACP methyl ester carboxylesterase
MRSGHRSPGRTRPGRSRRQRRRQPRLIWPAVIGLAVAGAAAAVLANRRRWTTSTDGELGESARSGAAAAPAVGPPAAALQSWIAGPAGNLYLRDTGGDESGRLPVLFVHGLGGNGGQWVLQLDHLRRSRRGLAIDLRGHGDSDPADDGAYGVAALAGDVAAAADHCALRRFVLAGHSLGAAVAIAYAAQHPERVAGLLLVDPNGDQTAIPAAQLAPFLDALRADPRRELEGYFRQLTAGGDREAARWVLEDLQLTAEEAIPAAVLGGFEFAPLPALARYGGPKLAVISDLNSLPYSLHRLVPDLPVELVRGTGHWLMMDRPEAFNRLLDAFLAAIEGGG